jgi:hypothetical protein
MSEESEALDRVLITLVAPSRALDPAEGASVKEDLMAACLRRLHDLGLEAQESRLASGGIIGGLEKVAVLDTWAYERSFLITPLESGYNVAVPGPGNQVQEETVATLDEAVEHVVRIYRERSELPP